MNHKIITKHIEDLKPFFSACALSSISETKIKLVLLIATNLNCDNARTHKNHKQGEERVESVFIKKPKCYTEKLEKGKWFNQLITQ